MAKNDNDDYDNSSKWGPMYVVLGIFLFVSSFVYIFNTDWCVT